MKTKHNLPGEFERMADGTGLGKIAKRHHLLRAKSTGNCQHPEVTRLIAEVRANQSTIFPKTSTITRNIKSPTS